METPSSSTTIPAMNPARFRQTPSWAQNPVQHSNEHHRISDAELKRKLAAEDAKEKHNWSTPDWAVVKQGNKISNKTIDKSSIERPMLKMTKNASKLVASEKPTADPADLEALQRKLAQAKLDAAAAGQQAPADPTANMTPEQKAKYEADARLEALRVQTEERELQAWKENQAERLAWEKQRRDEARAKALAEQKAREAQEKAEREKQRAKLQAESAAQQAKEAEVAAVHQAPSEVELLQQQIAAIQQQLEAAGVAAPASPTPVAAPVSPAATPAAVAPPPVVSPYNANKHRWSKPGWALPDEVIAQEAAIVSDSIQHGLKAPNTGGYERKVFAKELAPPPVKGKFVRPAAKAPPPRMVWTVLNINGIKRGKIVMHLYGNADAIVDKFLELKGLECKRTADHTLYCDELEPHFYFFGGKAAQVPTHKNPSAVYGVVLEGHDVLQLAQNAAPDAVIAIRQSHIFPVKRAKS